MFLVYSLCIVMSKIWKNPIVLPEGVKATLDNNLIKVQWPKGELSFGILPWVEVTVDGNIVTTACADQEMWKFWWTTRAIIAHMVHGVHTGYTKSLQVIGVGYDAALQWDKIQFKLGFSHLVFFPIPKWIEVKIEKDPKGNTLIHLASHDKQLIGETASKIRDLKKPEPYKGKGIRYVGEVIKLKAGKTAKK